MHVRIKLKRVFPAALEYIAMVLPIWPKAYREKVGADAFAKAPIGTGPVQDHQRGRQHARSTWSATTAISPAARRASRRSAASRSPRCRTPATEMAELLGGRADWIWDFSPDEFDTVAKMPALQAVRGRDHARRLSSSMDAAGRTRRRTIR